MHFFVAKLFSIAVMTYVYVYHLRNLRRANLLRTQRVTDRRTDNPTVANTGLCVASYADAL